MTESSNKTISLSSTLNSLFLQTSQLCMELYGEVSAQRLLDCVSSTQEGPRSERRIMMEFAFSGFIFTALTSPEFATLRQNKNPIAVTLTFEQKLNEELDQEALHRYLLSRLDDSEEAVELVMEKNRQHLPHAVNEPTGQPESLQSRFARARDDRQPDNESPVPTSGRGAGFSEWLSGKAIDSPSRGKPKSRDRDLDYDR